MSKFNDIVSSTTPTLIDFSAEWCQPCKMMAPILKDVKKQLGNSVRVLKIDVDKNPAIAQKHNIQSVPTLMIMKAGKIVFKQSGVIQSAQLVQELKNHSL